MRTHRALLSLALLALGLLSACALRPRYREVAQPEGGRGRATEGQVLVLRVVAPDTGQPIAGARLLAGTGRARLAATSDAEGLVSFPVSQALLDENPLVEVVLPKGVKQYRFQLVLPAEAPPAQAPGGGAP